MLWVILGLSNYNSVKYSLLSYTKVYLKLKPANLVFTKNDLCSQSQVSFIESEPGLEIFSVFLVHDREVFDVFQKNFHLDNVLKKLKKELFRFYFLINKGLRMP